MMCGVIISEKLFKLIDKFFSLMMINVYKYKKKNNNIGVT